VPFVEKDVAEDYTAAMEMIRRSGQQGVPVVATETEVVVGFDQARLARIAEQVSAPKRPALGLLGADAESYLARHPEAAAALPPETKGVFVGAVRPDTVADRAGIQPGDVVVALAGKRVKGMAGMDQLIGTLAAGDAVSVRFLRGDGDQTATLQF